jgi:endonuclease/exonuclease/phosphatase family metal-dependent hydrolase
VCARFGWSGLPLVAALALIARPASAQSVTLGAADATIRSGIYEDVNFGDQEFLETKSDKDADKVRRTLLKFDTHTTIPAGSVINSATLTLTVKDGSVPSRRLAVYCVPSSFDEHQTTWHLRKGALDWGTSGGDVRHQHGVVVVTNIPGSKVTIDVTRITREAMQTSSRYTRVLLVDVDRTDTASYMAYYSSEADPAMRPKLVVDYGAGTPVTPTPPPPPVTRTGTTLRVLQWNIQQGWTTNGKSNLDLVVDWVVKLNADVISFNEINHSGSPAADHIKIIADKLKARTGETWSYNWVQKQGARSGEGEAVMSRLPFVSTATNLLPYSRSAALAMVMVNGRAINVVSTHLDAWTRNYRIAEIRDLKQWIEAFAERRIIMGDFNSWPGTPEVSEMTKDYHDAWADAVRTDKDVAYPGNEDGHTRKTRIDYVFYSRDSTLVLKKTQVFDTRGAKGVRPSDHNPLLATFEVR